MKVANKEEFVSMTRSIRHEAGSLYKTNPVQASDYLRQQLRDIWRLGYPRCVGELVACLRVASNQVKVGTAYSAEQMRVLSEGLELCEKYEQLAAGEVHDIDQRLEVVGMRIGLEFDEESIKAFMLTPEERRRAIVHDLEFL